MERFEPQIKLEHSDSRGEIYSLQLPDDRELMLLFSKKGSLRGGHAHDVNEIVVVLTGSMVYKKRDEMGEESSQIVKGGQESYNAAGVYHLAEFLEDSWVLEWKINTNKKGWRNIDYRPYREKVNANAADK